MAVKEKKEKVVEAQVEPEAKVPEPVKPKTVRIAIPAPEGARKDANGNLDVPPVEVWINGVKTLVPVGQPIEVHENVYDVLRNAGYV